MLETLLINVLWFVLAGFVLGFATSLLWEWLYFRKRRLNLRNNEIIKLENRISSLQAQLDQSANGSSNGHQSATAAQPNGSAGNFQSSAALLESEQAATMPQARRSTNRPRAATPTVMPNAAIQAQAILDEELPKARQQLRTNQNRRDLPAYHPDEIFPDSTTQNNTFQDKQAQPTAPQTEASSVTDIGTNEEINGFNLHSYLETAGAAAIQPEEPHQPKQNVPVGMASTQPATQPAIQSPAQPQTHAPTSQQANIQPLSSHAQARLDSVTTVQPSARTRPTESKPELAPNPIMDTPAERVVATHDGESDVAEIVYSAYRQVPDPDSAPVDSAIADSITAPDPRADSSFDTPEMDQERETWQRVEHPEADSTSNQNFIRNAYADTSPDSNIVSYPESGYPEPGYPETGEDSFDTNDSANEMYQRPELDPAQDDESADALARYHDQYGQTTAAYPEQVGSSILPDHAQAGLSGAESSDADASWSTTQPELGNEADVDFYNESSSEAIDDSFDDRFDDSSLDEQIANQEIAEEEMDLPTVKGVLTESRATDLAFDAETDPVDSLPHTDPPWDEDPPKAERRFESAMPMPAAMVNAERSSAATARKINKQKDGSKTKVTPLHAKGRPTKKQKTAQAGIQKDEAEYPDDLTKVKGIGKVFQTRLYASGIYTWDQLHNSTTEVLEAAAQPRINEDVSTWIKQAGVLARKHNRIGATYAGPTPDDLSEINGLTPTNAARLYQNGITSYAQLGRAKKSTLATIFAGTSGADKLDFATWVKEAKKLAR